MLLNRSSFLTLSVRDFRMAFHNQIDSACLRIDHMYICLIRNSMTRAIGTNFFKLRLVASRDFDLLLLFSEFWDYLAMNEISALEACVTYAKSIPWASGIVVGAEDSGQLLEIVRFFGSERTLNFSSLPVLPQDFLDPRRWST